MEGLTQEKKYTREELNTFIECSKAHGKNYALLKCPACKEFPCRQLYVEGWVDKLYNCEAFEHVVVKWKRRRIRMYFIEYADGTITKVEELDEGNPDRDLIQNCVRVYKINKELEPVVVLKPASANNTSNSTSNRSSTGQVNKPKTTKSTKAKGAKSNGG